MLVPLSLPTVLVDTSPLESQALSDIELSPDSLFDEPQESSSTTPLKPQLPHGTRTTATTGPGSPGNHNDFTCTIVARRSAPPIPGLFFDPGLLLPPDLADSVLQACMTSFFPPPGDGSLSQVNQVMLFGRAGHEDAAFPPFLGALLEATSVLLRRAAALPAETHALLFPGAAPDHEGRGTTRARQAIINLYRPGEGIAPHVDLLSRFGDGIVGVSLGGGVAMQFARVGGGGEYEVWLPPRSVIVLTGEARYGWTHGIPPRNRDKVEEEGGDGGGRWQWHYREPRVSITFRWLLPGAEIVGGGGDSDSDSDGGGSSAGRKRTR
ncbi:hypothetical protein BJY52DRAFT_1110967 [Lactarius psammicola]|nr:hypothetical protein BJY52DRAFT_1110967 [Lactarius psammicola]